VCTKTTFSEEQSTEIFSQKKISLCWHCAKLIQFFLTRSKAITFQSNFVASQLSLL